MVVCDGGRKIRVKQETHHLVIHADIYHSSVDDNASQQDDLSECLALKFCS